MQVKRYEAINIQEALAKVKSDMGPDAIVLSTKRLPGENRLIEVLAAKDNGCEEQEIFTSTGRGDLKEAVFNAGDREILLSLRNEIGEIKSLVQEAGTAGRVTPSGERDRLSEEFAEIKESMNTFFDVRGLRNKGEDKQAPSQIYYYLLGRGLSREMACRLLDNMNQDSPSPEKMDYERGLKMAEELLKGTLGTLCRRVSPEEKEKQVKVFLGPTGVGKTTTLAKLAARYTLEQKKSVGLITTDTYRIAAVEQLKTYARIMGLPLEVASGRDTFRQSIERFQDKELILVDTPGRSREEGGYLSKLKEMLTGDWELETNLLLSLTSSRESLMDVVGRYRTFGYDQIILTKLDECTNCGIFYDVVERANKPVSYISTGQNVPQDIEQANPVRLAELIMRH